MASYKKMHLAKKMKATKDKDSSSTSTKGLTGSGGSKDEGSAKVALEDAGAGSSKQVALANKIKSSKQPIVKTIKVSKDTSVSKSPAPPSSMQPLVKKLTSSKKSAKQIVLPGCSAGTMDSISPIEPFLVKKIKKSSSPKEAEGSAAVSKEISMTKAPVLVMSSLENDLTKENRFDHLEDLTAVKKASLTHDGEERGLSKKASSEQRVLGKKSSTKKTRKHASEMNTSFKGESVSVEATNSKDAMDSPLAKNVGLEVEHIFVTASLPTEEEHTLTKTANMQEKQSWKKSLAKSASSLTNTAKNQEEFELVVKPSLPDESFFKKSTRKQKEKRMDKEASFTMAMGSGVPNKTSLGVNSDLATKSSLKEITSLTKKVSHSESIGSPRANSLPDLKKSLLNAKFPSKLKVAELDEAGTQKEPEEMVGSSSPPPEDMSDEGKYKESTHSSSSIRKIETRTKSKISKPNKSYTTLLPFGKATVVLKDLSTHLLKKYCASKWLRSFTPTFSNTPATSTTDSATAITALRQLKTRRAPDTPESETMSYKDGPPLYLDSTSKRSMIEPAPPAPGTRQTSVDVQTEPLNDDPYVGIEKHSKNSLTTPWQTNFGSRTLRKRKTESTEIQTEPDVSANMELTDAKKAHPNRLNSKFIMSPEPDNAIAPVHRAEAEVPSAQFTASTILEPSRALFPGSEVTHIEPHSIKHVAVHFCTDPCNKHFYAVKNDVTITTSTYVRTRGQFNKLPAEVKEGNYLTIRGIHQEIILHNYGDQPCAVFICKFRSEMREFNKYGDKKDAK